MEPEQICDSVFASAEAANAVREQLLYNFQSQGEPAGNKWKPLADSTLKRKRTQTPLVESGALRNAVYNAAIVYRDGYLVADVRDAKVNIHQFGTKRIPARPPVQFPLDAPMYISIDLKESLETEFKKNGYEVTIDITQG